MVSPKFSSGLFEQLGGVSWQLRSNYQGAFQQACSEEAGSNTGASTVEPIEHSLLQVEESRAADATMFQAVSNEMVSHELILIGGGLHGFWEDESRLEWQLWGQICETLGWMHDIRFFDTEVLTTEEAIYASFEEILSSGAEQVLTMDVDHSLSQQLSEGMVLIEVPTLEEMLSDPYAKRSFYQAVLPFISQ
ncbi:hypothetical protein QCB44_07045 [Thiomicrorhabdus sp. zzn3]|uniref:hypothetical protein n=1 Tax=Thiomicrorhabdus sp. zzn3 TaxID=3039775 RepID=UPI002436415E|nr:hypothetical protein [Thiomicrorhabdus sp. zzn3]MDG6778455.1 hypothetical protein [Thiomicrorhabdus sp. zzn3]